MNVTLDVNCTLRLNGLLSDFITIVEDSLIWDWSNEVLRMIWFHIRALFGQAAEPGGSVKLQIFWHDEMSEKNMQFHTNIP